jgi:thioesterase domain-containing protein
MQEWKEEIRRMWILRMDDCNHLTALVESLIRKLAAEVTEH